MRILYIGNFNRLSVGEPEIANALEKLSHQVLRMPETEDTIDLVREEIEKGNYDLLLFAKFRVGTPKQIEEFLRWCPIPTVMWNFDLYYGL